MNKTVIKQIIKLALIEDAAAKDITSNTLIAKSATCTGKIVARQAGVVAGLELAKAAFVEFDKSVKVKLLKKDGSTVRRGATLATVTGPTRSVLASERTALNFLGFLSGIATTTNAYVKETRPYKVKILDTRKTTPTLRGFQKYAVKCGGGTNHRFDLNELVLIKDNHRAIYKKFTSLAAAVQKFRTQTKKPIEVEVDTLDEFKDALAGEPDLILLDNMTTAEMRKAVAIARKLPLKKRPLLEASGGVTLRNVKAIAKTGVDHISIGALTHSHQNFDVSLEIKDA